MFFLDVKGGDNCYFAFEHTFHVVAVERDKIETKNEITNTLVVFLFFIVLFLYRFDLQLTISNNRSQRLAADVPAACGRLLSPTIQKRKQTIKV